MSCATKTLPRKASLSARSAEKRYKTIFSGCTLARVFPRIHPLDCSQVSQSGVCTDNARRTGDRSELWVTKSVWTEKSPVTWLIFWKTSFVSWVICLEEGMDLRSKPKRATMASQTHLNSTPSSSQERLPSGPPKYSTSILHFCSMVITLDTTIPAENSTGKLSFWPLPVPITFSSCPATLDGHPNRSAINRSSNPTGLPNLGWLHRE
mmetsp:Transcript_42384/g.111645  ORF Transcript_42384/g.111645 Transcript_42384/m.111645 type:complete len:208 (-) Transcript_42384:196-819(-)